MKELTSNRDDRDWITIREMVSSTETGKVNYRKALTLIFMLSLELKDKNNSGWAKVSISPDMIGVRNSIFTDSTRVLPYEYDLFFMEDDWIPFTKKTKHISKNKTINFNSFLYIGYSPLEVYLNKCSSRSDEYSLAATFYYMLTGIDPPEATERMSFDTLQPVSEINSDVTIQQSKVIMKALSVKARNRFKTSQVFIDELLRVGERN